MNRFATLTVFAAALVASIATSAPSWSLSDHDGGSVRTERGDGVTLAIALSANAQALPEVEGGQSPQGMPSEDGLQSSLTVELDLRSQGVFGVGREATMVHAELWMETDEGDWLVDELDVEVGLDEPALVQLAADGVFSGCAPEAPCDADLRVVLTQDGDARLRVRYDARGRVLAPLTGPAPKEAELLVAVAEG